MTGSSTNSNDRPTTSTIAYDAAGREISIRERTVYATIDDRWRFFANDGEGHILRRRDGTEPQAGGAFTQGTTTLDQQTSNHHMVYANGQQVAALDEAGTIDALSHVTGFANTNIGSTNVVVQDGETLQSIAQRIYGNSSLWYVLAAANALDANTALVAGTTLKAPEVTTNKNDASTFKPYNPSDITGPTSPGLPYIHAPPNSGCGTLGMIIMVVVMIIVTIYTAGAAAGAMGSLATSAGTATAAGTTAAAATAAAGGGFAATFGTGMAVLGGTYGATAAVVAGAVGAFAGSIASQAVGSAMGVAHFSWQQVAVDTVVGGVTAGFGAWAEGGNTLGQAAAAGGRELSTLGRVAQAVVGYGAMVGASVAVGRDPNFSWKAVAASAVGAYLSAEVGGQLPIAKGGGSTGNFFRDFGGNFVNGAINAEVRNAFGLGKPDWAQIGADAFGNALAGAIARSADAPRLTSPPSAAGPFGVANTFGPANTFGLFGFAGVNTDNAFSTNAFSFGADPIAMAAAAAQTSGTQGNAAQNGEVDASGASAGKTIQQIAQDLYKSHLTFGTAFTSQVTQPMLNWDYGQTRDWVLHFLQVDSSGTLPNHTDTMESLQTPQPTMATPSALAQDAAAAATRQQTTIDTLSSFQGSVLGDLLFYSGTTLSAGGNDLIQGLQSAVDVVTDSQSFHEAAVGAIMTVAHPIATYDKLRSAMAEFYAAPLDQQMSTIGRAGMSVLTFGGAEASVAKAVDYLGDTFATAAAASRLTQLKGMANTLYDAHVAGDTSAIAAQLAKDFTVRVPGVNADSVILGRSTARMMGEPVAGLGYTDFADRFGGIYFKTGDGSTFFDQLQSRFVEQGMDPVLANASASNLVFDVNEQFLLQQANAGVADFRFANTTPEQLGLWFRNSASFREMELLNSSTFGDLGYARAGQGYRWVRTGP